MSKYVFILGAGASKHAGAPLVADFLDKAREISAANPSHPYLTDFNRVFSAISKLQAVHSKSDLDFVNLESVFGAFEMADLLQIIPAEQPGLLDSMSRVITWTLDQTMMFSASNGLLRSSDNYHAFAALINECQLRGSDCTVITFNYDIGVDVALEGTRLSPYTGLVDNPKSKVKLFKLHGSVHWHRCSNPTCKEIVAESFPRLDPMGPGAAKMSWRQLTGIIGSRFEHCNIPAHRDSVIVPPSWNKGEHHSNLAKVWKAAAAELKDATTIVVCGYSLPETDSFFRYLYALGTVGEHPLQRFWIFDPSKEVHERFRKLLGPGALQRFRASDDTFERAIPYLNRELT